MMHPMKKLGSKIAFFLTVCLLSQPLLAARYQIDPSHSDISFKVKHLVVSKVRGNFNKFSGQFTYKEGKPKKWSAEATIETASVDTANADRDKHLRAPDFLDAEKFPSITFKSTEVTDVSGDKAKVHGLLNIHGVEKPVVLDLEIGGTVQDPWGNHRAGFEATTTINRKDFGIVWNKVLGNGGLVVGEKVEITLHIEGIKQGKKKKKKK